MQKKAVQFYLYYAALAAINIFLAMYFFYLYFNRRIEKYYLYFSILALSIGLFIIGYKGIVLWIVDLQFAYYFTTYFGAFFATLMMVLFLNSFLSVHSRIWNVFFISGIIFFSLCFIIEYLLTQKVEIFVTYLYNLFLMLSGIAIIYGSIRAYMAIRLDTQYAKPIFIGVFLFLVTHLISIFSFLDILPLPELTAEGFFIMANIFAYVLASRYSQVHTALEKAHDDLLVIDKMKDEFLATTSHELRTPLHAISGMAEIMETSPDEPPTEKQREGLSIIRRSADRLARLVDDILDFSRLRAGRVDLLVEEVDIESLLNGLASLAGVLTGDKPVTVRVEVGENLPVIVGDRHRMEQILLNLLANAVKFTDEGEVTLTAHTEGEGVNIAVRDTGCGIESEDMAHIWNPYRQLETADTRRHGGVGLGLAITRQLVEMHGGRISAVSEPCKGSLFTVWLPPCPPPGAVPLRRDQIEPACPPLPVPIVDGGEHDDGAKRDAAVPFRRRADTPSEVRVLVVDDDPDNRRILIEVLSRHSYRVRAVGDGPGAMEAVGEAMPHVVLLDIMLPGMSGFEVAAKIRETYPDIYIPIIMVTARSGMEDMVKGFAFGGNDYIVKPFNSNEVLARVENQLVISNMISMEKRVETFLGGDTGAEYRSLAERAASLDEAVRRLSEWESIISKDLVVARGFLSRLMRSVVDTSAVEYAIDYDPLFAIGGDVYDVHEYTPGKIRVFMGDATGHGIHASLNTITIMTEYGQLRGELASPSAMITALNERFCSRFSHYRIVFTCCIAEIDLFTGSLRFASAGHPTQFAVAGGKVWALKPVGPIIGFRKNVIYNETVIDFCPGSVLFLYTDGLLDEGFRQSPSVSGDSRAMHGEEYLRSVLEDLPAGSSPAEMCAAVKKMMKGEKRRKDRLTDDDISMIVLRRK
ncbi:MAG: SpoIIE family protein phosphatase [Spirochaetes bacterium]|nr:SpoIIE family protein phosphatase [Spirochaetota bacterium]